MGLSENEIGTLVLDAAFSIHKYLGPGLLESVYEEALAWELSAREFQVERQKLVPISYKGIELATPLRIDLLIDNLVIVECKATTEYNAIFETQTATYLRITGLKLGLVINFGEKYVKDGVHRVVNKI